VVYWLFSGLLNFIFTFLKSVRHFCSINIFEMEFLISSVLYCIIAEKEVRQVTK